jgi:hypothetical protein
MWLSAQSLAGEQSGVSLTMSANSLEGSADRINVAASKVSLESGKMLWKPSLRHSRPKTTPRLRAFIKFSALELLTLWISLV